jgi:hypothetical protein
MGISGMEKQRKMLQNNKTKIDSKTRQDERGILIPFLAWWTETTHDVFGNNSAQCSVRDMISFKDFSVLKLYICNIIECSWRPFPQILYESFWVRLLWEWVCENIPWRKCCNQCTDPRKCRKRRWLARRWCTPCLDIWKEIRSKNECTYLYKGEWERIQLCIWFNMIQPGWIYK